MMKAGGLAFGLYLWHWVFLSFYQYHNEGTPTLPIGLGIIILSFTLSWLMTRFIETPIRSMDIGIKPLGILTVALAANLIIAFALYTSYEATSLNTEENFNFEEYPGALAIKEKLRVATSRENYLPSAAEAKTDLADSYVDEANQSKMRSELITREYGVLEGYDHTLVLTGSSHAAHWLGALQQFAEEENIRIINMTQLGSRFSASHQEGPQKEWNDNVLEFLKSNKEEIDLVVATTDIGLADFPKPPEGMVEQLNRIGDDIGLPVMAIRDNQRFGFNIPEHLEQYGYESTKKKMLSVEAISETAPWELVDYKSPNVHPVDYTEYFKVEGEYEPIIGNVLIYYDGGHINNTYATTMGPIIKEDVMELLNQ
ncbi:acyltransferase family protein [Salinicoccus roseus]|uniref:acyltransferase family protein n=1 Tax=Salinicoccus roseus TaxID=45670 RepID=UPI00230079B2|nr:SGNH hydrolase domain-containing protein [Salinicoccus roseus]